MKLSIKMDNATVTAVSDDGDTLFSYEVNQYDVFLDTEAIINEAANIARLVNSLSQAFIDAAQPQTEGALA